MKKKHKPKKKTAKKGKKKVIKKIWLHTNRSPKTLKFYEKMKFKNLGRTTIKVRGIKVTLYKMEKYF